MCRRRWAPAQGFAKDRTVGQASNSAEIKSQPWAQGFGDQIDAAYAASRRQGGLLDVQA
jgi:hypothetical protein